MQHKKIVLKTTRLPDKAVVLIEGKEYAVRCRRLMGIGSLGVYRLDFTEVDKAFETVYRNGGRLPIVTTAEGQQVFPSYS